MVLEVLVSPVYSLSKNIADSQSEKENSDHLEDDSKIESSSNAYLDFKFNEPLYASNPNMEAIRLRPPYLEIHSPPPEFV